MPESGLECLMCAIFAAERELTRNSNEKLCFRPIDEGFVQKVDLFRQDVSAFDFEISSLENQGHSQLET